MLNKDIQILVVDDELQLRKNIKIILEKKGFKVDLAENGWEAIEKIKTGKYNLVITDLVMPEVDGLEVLKYIRDNHTQVVTIVITAYASMNTAIDALRSGAYDFIVKPFDNEILALTVKQAVEKIGFEQLKQDFIAMLTHDIKSPLTSILGFSSLLIGGKLGETNDSIYKAGYAINTSGRKILTLIEDFLASSRIDEGKMEANLFPFDLRETLDEVSRNFGPELKEKEISFEVEVEETLPEVVWDEILIERIISNLISNAIKFTPKGGDISLVINYNPDEEMVIMTLSDSGDGISEEDINFIFDKFKRARGIKTSGTGLGLFICKSLIKVHGGNISVISKLGEGTTFIITLPVSSSKMFE